jgi:hypothetical protein
MFIVILTTNLSSARDLALIKPGMDELLRPGKWSIDLDDEDKILRLLLQANIVAEVRYLLRKRGFRCTLLNIYHADYGIEYPLIKGENRVSGSTFISYSLLMIFHSLLPLPGTKSGSWPLNSRLATGSKATNHPGPAP